MNYHKTVKQIVDLLTSNKLWFQTFEHDEVKTSEDAARVRPGYTLQQGAKALIVKVENIDRIEKFMMLVIPAQLKLDNKKTKDALGLKSVRFATPAEVEQITGGVQSGGVPPLGNLFDLAVVADPMLLTQEKIVFNAGDRRFSIAMLAQDYKTLVNPLIANIA